MRHFLIQYRYILLALILANMVFFCLVNPESSKSLVLFGGFFLLAADFYLGLKVVLLTAGRLLRRPSIGRNRVAGLVTLVIIVLLALQSIGQLSARDAVAVICAGVIFLFYSSYYRFGHHG